MSSDYLRVFVGGLSQTISEGDLRERFEKYGKVSDVTIKSKTDPTGEWLKSFGYVNIHITKESFGKCKSQLNNASWKGGKLSIQLAKMDPVKRVVEATTPADAEVNESDTKKQTPTIPTIKKGAVPGTLLEEHDNWVVTKFQRVVPIMKIRSKDKKKLITYNPAKHSHQIKNLEKVSNKNQQTEDDADSQLLGNLTWNLDDSESQRSKLQNSEFTGRSRREGRSAQQILALEKAKKEKQKLEDDLEVVPSNPNKTSELTNGHKTTLMNTRSKFDSDTDSDSEIEFNMNAKCAPATPYSKSTKRTPASMSAKLTLKSNGSKVFQKAPESKTIEFSSSTDSSEEEPAPKSSSPTKRSVVSHGKTTYSSSTDSDNESEQGHPITKNSATKQKYSAVTKKSTMIKSKLRNNSSSNSENELQTTSADTKSEHGSEKSETGCGATNTSNTIVKDVSTCTLVGIPKQTANNRGTITENKKKHEKSDKQRLEAMKIRQAQLKAQQQLIKSALCNPDSAPNKKKTFNSSDDNSSDDEIHKRSLTTSNLTVSGSKSAKSTSVKPNSVTSQSGGLTLFNDSSSSDEDDLDERFKIKKQFEGEKGAKLLSLQQTYKEDGRFKLTENFISDDSGDSSEPERNNKSDDSDVEITAADERKRSLQILQSIVGSKNVRVEPEKPTRKRVADTSANVFRDVNSVQFDPTDDKTSHLVQEVNTSDRPTKPKKHKSGVDPVVGNEPAPVISKDTFYEVNMAFNETREDNSDSNSTGLFNFFNEEQKQDESSDEDIEEMTTPIVTNKQTVNITSGHQFNFFNTGEESDDSSSDDTTVDVIKKSVPLTHKLSAESASVSEREDNSKTKKTDKNKTEKMDTISTSSEPADTQVSGLVDHFFFTLSDPRLKTGRDKFSRTLSDEEIRKRWLKIKQQLIQDYKKKSYKYRLNEKRNVHLSRRGDNSEPNEKKHKQLVSKNIKTNRMKKK